jgi:hypothetical protein
MDSVAVRVLLALLAVIMGVWFANGLHSLDLEAKGLAATRLAQRHRLPPAGLESGRDAFQAARRFNADQAPLISEGLLLSASGRRKQAYRMARRVTASEPENSLAWFLARLTAPDRRHADAATRVLRKLNPELGG